MRIFLNFFAAVLMIILINRWCESHEMSKSRIKRKNFMNYEGTDSISNEESQEKSQDDLNNLPKLTKFRRCGKTFGRNRKHGKPRGAFEGYGFFVPHSDSQYFEQLVRQGKAVEPNGGEIFEPKRKNSTSIFGIIKKFLKNFRLRGSSTPRPHEISSPDEEEWEPFVSTTTDNSPVELILPVSGPFLNSSTTRIPDDVTHEMAHTFYESLSEDTQGKNSEHSSESSGAILFGGRHATFDLEIKAIPIGNRQRIAFNGIN